MRTQLVKNVEPFECRASIDTDDSLLLDGIYIDAIPLKEFDQTLQLQEQFLEFIERSHHRTYELRKQILDLEKQSGRKRSMPATEGAYLKYRWYAETLVLLEAINAFETFYKRTIIGLGELVQEFVRLEDMKGQTIDARLLWSITDPISIPALVFQHKVFHDLGVIDNASWTLIGKKRYKPNSSNNPLERRVKALKAIFQIRHTLSHNCGKVTTSDATKFRQLGFEISDGGVIDPNGNGLSIAIVEELRTEAREYTDWLAMETADFFQRCIKGQGLTVPFKKRKDAECLLGESEHWDRVSWSEESSLP